MRRPRSRSRSWSPANELGVESFDEEDIIVLDDSATGRRNISRQRDASTTAFTPVSQNTVVSQSAPGTRDVSLNTVPRFRHAGRNNQDEPSAMVLPYMIWTAEMEIALLERLREATAAGESEHGHFKRRVWLDIVNRVQAACTVNEQRQFVTEKRCKSKLDQYKRMWKTWKPLYDTSGFNWSESDQLILADDASWDDYIKAHPDAAQFRLKSIPHKDLLHEILARVVATGQRANDGEYLQEAESQQVEITTTESSTPTDRYRKRSNASPFESRRSKKPRSAGESIAEAMQEHNELLKRPSEKIRALQLLQEDCRNQVQYRNIKLIDAIEVLETGQQYSTYLSLENQEDRVKYLQRKLGKDSRRPSAGQRQRRNQFSSVPAED